MKNQKVLVLILFVLILTIVVSGSVEAKKNKERILFCIDNEMNETAEYRTYVNGDNVLLDGRERSDFDTYIIGANEQDQCSETRKKFYEGKNIASVKWRLYQKGDFLEKSTSVWIDDEIERVNINLYFDTRGTLEATIKKPNSNKDHRYQTFLMVDSDETSTVLNKDEMEVTKTKTFQPGNYDVKLKWENRVTKKSGEESVGRITINTGQVTKITIRIVDGSKENRAPSFEDTGPFSGEVGKSIDFKLKATDPDGDPVQFSTKSQYCTTNKEGQSFCKFNSEGTHKETFSAKDDKNNEAYLDVDFQIKKSPSPEPPKPPKTPGVLEVNWSKTEIGDGEIVELTAKTKDVENGKDISIDIYEKGKSNVFETKKGKINNNWFRTQWTAQLKVDPYQSSQFYFVVRVDGAGTKDSNYVNVLPTKEVQEALKEVDNILKSGSAYIIIPEKSKMTPEADRLRKAIEKKYNYDITVGSPNLVGNRLADKIVAERNLIIVDAENNYFYQKYITDKFSGSGQEIKITKNPAIDSRRKSILLGKGENTLVGLRLIVENGANSKWGFKEALVSCLWTDDNTPIGGDVINFGCNIMPVIELGPDVVDTYKCLTNGTKEGWDQTFCYLTYIGATVDVGGYAGSIFTLGIAGGVAEAIDVYLQVFRKAVKLAKTEGLEAKIADDVWKFVKESKENIIKLGKALYKIGADKEAVKDIFKFISKFSGDRKLIGDIFEILNKNPETGKSVLRRIRIEKFGSEAVNDAVKIGKLVSNFKVTVNIDIPSGEDLKKIVGLFSDGKFSSKLESISKSYKVEGKLKEITFVTSIGDKTSTTAAGIELEKGIPTGRMLIRSSIDDIEDFNNRILQHELSHLTADSKIAEIASKLGKAVSDVFPDEISTGKLDQFNEYLADSLYKGKLSSVDAKDFEKQMNKNFDNTNYKAFGMAFSEFVLKGTKETSAGIQTLRPIRESAFASKIGRTDHIEKIREAVRKYYPYPKDENGLKEITQKFDDMVASFTKLGDEIDQKLLSDSTDKLSKAGLEKVTKEVKEKIDDFVKNNGILSELKPIGIPPASITPGKIILVPPITLPQPTTSPQSSPTTKPTTMPTVIPISTRTPLPTPTIIPPKPTVAPVPTIPIQTKIPPTSVPTITPKPTITPTPTFIPTPTITPELPEKTLEDYPNKWVSGHVSSSLARESVSFKDGKLWLIAGWSTTAISIYKQKYANLEVEADITGVSSSYLGDHIQPGIILRSSDPVPQKTTITQIVRSGTKIIWQPIMVDNGNSIDSFIKVGFSTRGDTLDVFHNNQKKSGSFSAKYNFDVGKTYKIKVRLIDDMISVWVDDKLVIDNYRMAKGAYLETGYAGFATQGSETATLDNFVIKDMAIKPLYEPLITKAVAKTATIMADGKIALQVKIANGRVLTYQTFDVKKGDVIKIYGDVYPNGRPVGAHLLINGAEVYRNGMIASQEISVQNA